MTYLKCLAAYLTGWVIVQGVYNRLLNAANRGARGQAFKQEVAEYVAASCIDLLDGRQSHYRLLQRVDDETHKLLQNVLFTEGQVTLSSNYGLALARLRSAHDRASVSAVVGGGARGVQ